MVISELDPSSNRNSLTLKSFEEAFRLGYAGERDGGLILKDFGRNTVASFIYTVENRLDWECRNGQRGNRPTRLFLDTCGLRTLDRAFGFAPASERQQFFAFRPLGRIDSDEIHVAIQAAMLESIVENEQVAQSFALCQLSGFEAIGANNDRRSGCTLRNEEWLISGLMPWNERSIAATDN